MEQFQYRCKIQRENLYNLIKAWYSTELSWRGKRIIEERRPSMFRFSCGGGINLISRNQDRTYELSLASSGDETLLNIVCRSSFLIFGDYPFMNNRKYYSEVCGSLIQYLENNGISNLGAVKTGELPTTVIGNETSPIYAQID